MSKAKLPWFTPEGESRPPFIIGIAGASASGKTSVANSIIERLGEPWVTLLCMDSFYKALSPDQIALAHKNDWNFDHPNSFDHEKLYETLLDLKKGRKVEVPVYDFATHSRFVNETESIYGSQVVIFEGIFALYDKNLRDLFDLKLFVDTDADVCLSRRLKRDISERGRDLEGVLQQYSRFVKPSFDDFIFPTKKHADMIIPRGLENTVGIDVITRHVRYQLDQRSLKLRSLLCLEGESLSLSNNTTVIEQNDKVKHLQRLLSSESTNREEFVKASNELASFVLDEALQLQSTEEKSFTLYAVNILNGGAPFLINLLARMPSLKHGSIAINNCPENDPTLGDVTLDSMTSDMIVLLLDDEISTGATALMAIRVLLDHGVMQEDIVYSCLFATALGLSNVHRAFPSVKIVTGTFAEVSAGSFSERYFGPNKV